MRNDEQLEKHFGSDKDKWVRDSTADAIDEGAQNLDGAVRCIRNAHNYYPESAPKDWVEQKVGEIEKLAEEVRKWRDSAKMRGA